MALKPDQAPPRAGQHSLTLFARVNNDGSVDIVGQFLGSYICTIAKDVDISKGSFTLNPPKGKAQPVVPVDGADVGGQGNG